jgi:hypothetical protein
MIIKIFSKYRLPQIGPSLAIGILLDTYTNFCEEKVAQRNGDILGYFFSSAFIFYILAKYAVLKHGLL